MSDCQRQVALCPECDASPFTVRIFPWSLASREMSGGSIGPRVRFSLYRGSHLFVKPLRIYEFAAVPAGIGRQNPPTDGSM